MPKCAHPNCLKEGEFSAPVNPHNLRLRQYFCAEHIKEFNKKWDGLAGMNAEEIKAYEDVGATWHRPTWPMGSEEIAANHVHFETAEDLFSFFKSRTAAQPAAQQQAQSTMLPPDVKEACSIFNITEPLPPAPLKEQYLKLIKKHHPDISPNKEAATEMVKKINVAYKILKDFKQQ